MTELLPAVDSSFEFTPTHLVVHGAPTRDEWLAAYENLMGMGKEIEAVKDSWRWNVGDMLVYGELSYGEAYAQAVGYQEQTVRNIMTACRQIPPERRIPGLGFWKHYEAIGLPTDQQDRLLRQAAKEDWSKHEVRLEKKLLQGIAPPQRYSVIGRNADRDVHGVTPVIVVEYFPETEDGDLPRGRVEVIIRKEG